MDDLLQEFIAETRETLEAISGEIVGWEADPSDRARLDSIFRFVHTIKGSCGFLDLPRLARLSHAAEDALAAVRAGERAPDQALVTVILAIIDRIGEIVEAIDAGEALSETGEALLIAALDGALAGDTVEVAEAAVDAPTTTQAARAAPKRSVRLSVDLLDRMMSGVSDMVLARNQLARHLRMIDDPRLESMLERLSISVDELRDTVTRTRMQRVESLFSALPRLARDAAAALDKSVALTIEGGDVELDREMIELLRDPLVHLVRNAVDHGIEDRAGRLLAGKPVAGQLRIVARQAGNLIIIEISDDGRGIDSDRLLAKALREQPARAAELAMLDEDGRLRLIFEAGLSSRDEVTALSGRGVGMDVVKANVEQAGGRISLTSRPGQGLTIALEVPLTLAILNAVLVDAAGTRFAIPRQSVDEIVAVDGGAVRVDRVAGGAVVLLRGQRLPMVSLPVLLGQAGNGPAPRYLAIVSLREGRFALALDGVRDTQELVVKPAAPAVMCAGLYAGQMLPDDGAPILLLDCSAIATRAALTFERADVAAAEVETVEPVRALLFDDIDGVRRMIVSDAVDRIEGVAAGAVRALAGGLWLTIGDRSIPVWAGTGAIAGAVRKVLRLQLDGQELAYPIADPIEIVPLPPELAPAADPHGVIAGLAVIDGEPIELVDPLALFADATAVAERPLCLLHGAESGWMEAFLKPAIEQAGYRVVRKAPPGVPVALALAMDDDVEVPPAPALRLSRERGRPLYRFDRAALIAALKGYAA
ncbi:two-component system chemotaxis sensor kinase CheA [Sphingomonas sp. BE138]|uniref:chemotaxis protein CheA n=1 Tax=Sphingomonas sp. BE138 TaxID=2817845 RepID=UPI002864B4FE|nr:chemotaxis protein CheW [Sphingomonas sp. BE138]MDR6789647.1 two-component system chemotaxis sensor kinase CheA [Sphingomonas sp. BE138]